VIDNLVTNAIKFSNPHGQIDIKIFSDQSTGGVVLVIKDYGIGMPPDMAKNLFGDSDSFRRLGSEGECSRELGLKFVSDTIQKH